MKSIEDVKNNLINTLTSIDLNKLSIFDLKTYAEIMKITAETKESEYFDSLIEKFSRVASTPMPGTKTISEMR